MTNEQINPTNVIAAVISQWETAFIEPDIFGTGNQLWPTPHSQLFDFEATNVGTEWIDDYASRTKQVLLHGKPRKVVQLNSLYEAIVGWTMM